LLQQKNSILFVETQAMPLDILVFGLVSGPFALSVRAASANFLRYIVRKGSRQMRRFACTSRQGWLQN
jgi:hypothetical protein